MERVIYGTLALTLLFGMGLWMGYRLGFANGLATWRKDYRSMSSRDVADHKRIVATMADK